jgi:putative FmdB family regulatory protein
VPRYDYRCEAGHKYEKIESFGAPAVQPCQRCGKEARRQLVPPTVVFKGPGFYATSGRGTTNTRTSSGDGASSSNGSSASTKSESSTKAADTKAERVEKVKPAD